jgi:diguanylate cyclase (GGDEF)-like protein/PAS domain S-box-containing protein
MASPDLTRAAELGAGEGANVAARLARVLGAANDDTLGVAAETCLEELARYVGVDRAFVVVLDEHERIALQWVWDHSGRPFNLPSVGARLEEISGSAAAFFRIGRSLAAGNLDGLIDLSPDERSFVADNGGMPAAVMMLPVMVGDDVCGLVGLQSMSETKVWSRQFVAEIETLAELIVRMLGRTQQRQALAMANARARRIAAHLPDGLLMLSTDGLVVWVSPSFEAMSGVAAQDLEHRRFVDLVSPPDRNALVDQLGALGVGADASLAVRIADPAGHWRWADLSLRLASEPDRNVSDEIVVTVRDAHDRHLREMQLVRDSDRDPLTGLANRGAFDRFIAELLSSEASVLVAFCDVDDFKRFNDELGHDTGDEILRLVAGAIDRAVRSRDMVARIGGDEFALVVVEPGADPTMLGERLVRAIRTAGSDVPGRVTLSVGVCGPGPAHRARAMLSTADEAMYSAKRAGKDRWVHTAFEVGLAPGAGR